MSATQAPELEDAGSAPRLTLPSRVNPPGAGWDWIASGWRIFRRAPLMWIIAIILVFVVALVTSLVPLIGSLAFQLLQGVIAGGFMAACHSLARGGDFELEHLLSGLKRNFVNLLLLGVFLVVCGLLIMLVLAMFVGASVVTAFMGGVTPEHALDVITASVIPMLLGGLVALALTVPMLAAYWFAPALVMLNDLSPVAALKESFIGSFRNFVPFLVYGIVMTVFAILAAIPFGLGFLVWVPLAIASTYTAYRSIFTDTSADEPAVTV